MSKIYYYVVLKKNQEFLAVITNYDTDWELGHYYDQGYAFLMEVSAFSARSAIEVAKQNENSEIIKLQAELNSLRQENQKLLIEISNIRYKNNSRYSSGTSNINPLDVLGFDSSPGQEELKKRYKQLAQKFHPDKDGNNFLMQLIDNAYKQLKGTCA